MRATRTTGCVLGEACRFAHGHDALKILSYSLAKIGMERVP
jgi:hypothetical protein